MSETEFPKTQCHGPCGLEKENFLFAPKSLASKSPQCRMCMAEKGKQARIRRNGADIVKDGWTKRNMEELFTRGPVLYGQGRGSKEGGEFSLPDCPLHTRSER